MNEYEEQQDSVGLENTQKQVKRWLELDGEISALNKAVAERKKEKNMLTESIIQFMKNHEIPFFALNKLGKLSLRESTSKMPLNQKMIRSAIETELPPKDAENLRKLLFEERPTVSKFLLKYKKPTAGMLFEWKYIYIYIAPKKD